MTLLLVLFVNSNVTFTQEITGDELIRKSQFNFHDPNGNWETFKGELICDYANA